MEEFAGKRVVITGASSGLGLEIVKLMLKVKRVQIVAMARNVAGLGKIFKECDLPESTPVVGLDLEKTDEEIQDSLEAAFKVHGGIDILINCAGLGFRGRVSETLSLVDHRMMQVDYFGQIALIKGLLKLWNVHDARCGDIVQISSVQGLFGLGDRAPYSAAKHALVGFIDSLRVEVDLYPMRSPFRIFHICPGYIATNHSVNAITGDGSVYRQRDSATVDGYDPAFVATEALCAIARGDREVIIAPFKVLLLIKLRHLAPSLSFRLLRNVYLGRRENIFSSIMKWLFGIE
jgi:dehydrogenase/reductase SDR family protein 7B